MGTGLFTVKGGIENMEKGKVRSVQFFAALTLQLCLLTSVIAQAAGPAASSSLDDLQVPAGSLAGNLLGDPTTQQVLVYLPPSYSAQTAKRYPTLYLLHGYLGRPDDWFKGGYQGLDLRAEMDALIAKGAAAEMIVVVPNGRNAYLGSFYTNSAVTGNWEDYISRDLVNYIDKKYRTLAKPSSRGIAGHSMGGYGAFMLGMEHPDVFGAVYSLSPCCVGMEGDLSVENAVWPKVGMVNSRDIFKKEPASFDDFFSVAMIAISAAFSPNKERAPMFVDHPFIEHKGRMTRNEPAYSNYRSKMPLYLIEQKRANLLKLRGIALDVGEFEEFSHIRNATPMLSNELSKRAIPHSFEIYKDGDHGNKIKERLSTKVIPFFTAVLEK